MDWTLTKTQMVCPIGGTKMKEMMEYSILTISRWVEVTIFPFADGLLVTWPKDTSVVTPTPSLTRCPSTESTHNLALLTRPVLMQTSTKVQPLAALQETGVVRLVPKVDVTIMTSEAMAILILD